VRARLSYEEDPPFFEQEEWIVIQVTSGYAALARSHNERAVGTFLDQAVAIGVDPDFQSFLDSLNPITNDEYTNVLDMLHGAAYDAQTSTALATGSRYAAMLAERPPRCDRPVTPYRRDQPSLDPCGLRLLTPWVKGFGLFSDHDASEEDWSHAGGGVAFGADQRVPGDFILSGLVGTSRSVLDLEHGGDGSYTSLDIGAGIAWQRDPWHVRGTLVYAHGWHETYRQIDSPLFAQPDGSHESDGVTLLADGGYTFVLSPFELEPIVGLEYSHLAQGSIDESGGGVVDLEVDSRSDDLFATNAGIRAGAMLVGRGDLGAWSSGLWRSEVRASWRQVWTGHDREFDAQLAGAPGGTPSFQVETQDAQYGAILGGGISFQPEGSHTTIGIDYDAFVGEDTLAHTVLATLRVPF